MESDEGALELCKVGALLCEKCPHSLCTLCADEIASSDSISWALLAYRDLRALRSLWSMESDEGGLELCEVGALLCENCPHSLCTLCADEIASSDSISWALLAYWDLRALLALRALWAL